MKGRVLVAEVFDGAQLSWPHAAYTNKELPTFDAGGLLAAIPVRSLVIAGAHDMVPPERVKALADGLPRAEFVVFERSGHFSPVEELEGLQRRPSTPSSASVGAHPPPADWARRGGPGSARPPRSRRADGIVSPRTLGGPMPRRSSFLFALAGAAALAAFPSAAAAADVAESVRARYTKYEYRIPMRDGVQALHRRLRPEGRQLEALPDPAQRARPTAWRRTAATRTRTTSARRQAVGARRATSSSTRTCAAAGCPRASSSTCGRTTPQQGRRRTSTRAPTPTTRSTGW